MLSRVREGRAWNGHKAMSDAQMGTGNNYIVSDYETLLSRRLQVLVKNDAKLVEKFKDAPIVVGEKVLRDALNNKIVEGFSIKTSQAMHYYHADDRFCGAPLSNTMRNRILRAPSNMTEDAIGLLPLVPGMKVMVTDNVAMRGGVANGCLGTVQDIKYELNSYGQRRVVCAYVQVPGATIQAPRLPPDVITIFPETITFKYKMEGDVTYSIRRTQLPLLPAYAFTVNKIQGQSLQYVLVDLRSARGTQALYVMISRAVSLENLAVMHWFPSINLDRRLLPTY